MSTTVHLLLAIGLLPLVALLLFAIPKEKSALISGTTLLSAAANLAIVASTLGKNVQIDLPWMGSAYDLSLRVYHTSSVVTTAAAVFGLLITLFSREAMKGHGSERLHYVLMLLTLGMVNGAVFANSLLVLLFFWEGLLGTTYGMIVIGHEGAFRTGTKAFIISGIGDLCFMMGIALVLAQTSTVKMSELHLSLEGVGGIAYVLLMIGALAKCGALPFHSWIPDAAIDAPSPFMAFLPASIEKLLGIYFLSRLTLDLYELTPGSWVSSLLMSIGAVTLVVAVMMALVQTDYRRLLAFCAISQVGFILLGIGSATTVGIVGGLFHMFNHATYKSCLFLTAGAVERQTKTSSLDELGGLRKTMPVTFYCFMLAAASGAGVPLFAGFFSKELIFDAVLESGTVYYVSAIAGSFLTTLAFLKLGHAAFFGDSTAQNPAARANAAGNADTSARTNAQANLGREVTEAPLSMLAPMVVLAALTLVFGFGNHFPVERLVQPMLPEPLLNELAASGHGLAGWPKNLGLVALTVLILSGAALSHAFGVKLNGDPRKATDHIRQTPGLDWVFTKASLGWFDPYELFMKVVNGFAFVTYKVDRANDWLFVGAGRVVTLSSGVVRSCHRGNTSSYILWSLLAATVVILYLGK